MINSAEAWNLRYLNGDSGYGSYGEQAKLKLRLLEEYIDPDDVKSVIDFGCGDFYFGARMMRLFPEATYLGVDQSSEVIAQNIATFNSRFVFKNATKIDNKADLLVCIDVLLHVLEPEEEAKILKNLYDNWKKYLIVSAFDHNGQSEPDGHAVMRELDTSLFGEPIAKVLLEPNGCHLHIWKK
jgi:trans-aconitate methyltransferase